MDTTSYDYNEMLHRAVLSHGSDYDIARLFLQMFPNCQRFSDKEISHVLSNQIYTCFATKANQYNIHCVHFIDKNNEIANEYLRLYEICIEVGNKLKSNYHKRHYIYEIKMLR